MKYAPLVLLLTLAACSDKKPEAPPQKPATADVGVAMKPTAPVVTPPADPAAPAQPEAGPADASSPGLGSEAAVPPADPGVEAAPKAADEPAPAATEEKKPAESKKPESGAKSADAKSADAPAAAPAKVEELSVQVLQEGSGPVVKRGDTVTLEYTISYMPKPSAEKKDDKKKDTKGAKKPDAKKNGDEKKADDKKADEKKPEDAKPKDGDKPADDKKEAAATEPKDESADKPAEKALDKSGEKSDEKPAEKSADKPADKTAEKKDDKKDDKAADAKPVEPLKPVIVASTKSFTTPFTVKLTENGKPKLIPGLVRGVEGLKVGTRARILVPAALAYGKEGSKSAGIPPETSVEIEVLVKDARE